MDSSGLVSDFLSPESTVTSLLSSSGHLRSSLRPPEHNSTFRYRDKDYDSASAALDAYIADFERSHGNSTALTGQIALQPNVPSTPSRPRLGTLRNKDVLRERLTYQELNFLNLPVSSLRHRSNRDRLSMTTDELLSIPNDGSMPVTHTSAFIQGLLSRSEASQHRPSSRPVCRTCTGLSSSQTVPHHQNHHSLPPRTSRSCRCKGRTGAAMFRPGVDITSASSLKSAHRAARSEWAEPSSSLHLPRWLTSNKADMNCSGISSVPDFNYPAWIQRCDLSEPPPSSELWGDNGVLPPAAPRTGAPSWVEDLEKDDGPDNTPAQVDNQKTLRDLRLQLAEQISVIAAERKDSMTALLRDNRIESLIQKADQVLNSLSQGCGGSETPAEPVISAALSPANTEDLLLCRPSLCPPVALDSAAGGDTESLADIKVKFQDYSSHETSVWKQPGPVEALKQMLFRLQSVESELQRQQEASAAPELRDGLQTPEKQFSDGEAELQSFPGRPSLQRALHHLNRLKLLVEEPTEKRREEEEEKDEDEGRYSSSSADGLVISQKEPS